MKYYYDGTIFMSLIVIAVFIGMILGKVLSQWI